MSVTDTESSFKTRLHTPDIPSINVRMIRRIQSCCINCTGPILQKTRDRHLEFYLTHSRVSCLPSSAVGRLEHVIKIVTMRRKSHASPENCPANNKALLYIPGASTSKKTLEATADFAPYPLLLHHYISARHYKYHR